MSIYTFFNKLMDLERINRAPGKFSHEKHNVAAHSWKVSQYAQFLAQVEEMNGATINWKKLFLITTNHDFGEVFTGDIKTTVKNYTPALRQAIREAEEDAINKFIDSRIPDEFKDMFHEQLKEGKDGSLEGLILEVADKLDQVFEAYFEMANGNSEEEFVDMYRNALIAIKKVDIKCVEYILEVVIPDMINQKSRLSVWDIRELTKEALSA